MTKLHRILWLALLGVCPSGLAVAQTTQCHAGEATVFSCSVGAKVVSVCASSTLTEQTGTLAYRFGPPGKPEIDWPPPAAWRASTGSGVWMFSGGGGAWLAIHRDPFRYIVYTAIGRGWGTKDGVAVEKNGKTIANLPCKVAPKSELGPDFFARAGIKDDPVDFDLPP